MKKYLPLAILLVNVKLFSQCYTVTQTTYVADTTQSNQLTQVTVADDQWSQVIPIGFTFCFYGVQYDSILMGNNGMLTFDTNLSGGYCQWPIPFSPIPNPTLPKNVIMGPWADLSNYNAPTPSTFYQISGTAPNRTFTAKYDSISMYSCFTDLYSGRIVLHETTNSIEVQIDIKPACPQWNAGRATLGIQNQTGLMGLAVPGRNATNWTAANEGWLFTPICSVCSGVGLTEEMEHVVSIYPNPSSGTFTIDAGTSCRGSFIEICDVTGRVVEREAVLSDAKIEIQIEISGLYFVRLFGENNTVLSTQKLIVQ